MKDLIDNQVMISPIYGRGIIKKQGSNYTIVFPQCGTHLNVEYVGGLDGWIINEKDVIATGYQHIYTLLDWNSDNHGCC